MSYLTRDSMCSPRAISSMVGICTLLFGLTSGGCSAQSSYEGIQASARIACTRRPPGQYDECMARADVSFEDYQRQRAELLVD